MTIFYRLASVESGNVIQIDLERISWDSDVYDPGCDVKIQDSVEISSTLMLKFGKDEIFFAAQLQLATDAWNSEDFFFGPV